MSFADQLKGWPFKRATPDADPRRSHEPMIGGAAAARSENPYLAARRTWNEHVGSVVSARQTWQLLSILSLLIALAGVGGIIHIGSQAKFVPYVVQVDKLGQALAVAPAERAAPADVRVIERR